MEISKKSVNIIFSKKAKKTGLIFLAFCLVALLFIRFSFNTEYIGFYAEECEGTCRIECTITTATLVVDRYSSVGEEKPLSHTIIKGNFANLKFKAPLLLLLNVGGSFGCPDCNDGGGYVLGFNFLGKPFKFAFDNEASPWYFTKGANLVHEKLKQVDKIESSQTNR